MAVLSTQSNVSGALSGHTPLPRRKHSRHSAGRRGAVAAGERAPEQAENNIDDQAQQVDQTRRPMDVELPKSGLFSLADPKAEVYSKAGEAFDPTKRGGRFKPEFIWQTNWQEQLKIQEDNERQRREYQARQAAGNSEAATGPGVVSFSRLGALDDMSMDMSAELRAAQERQRARDEAQQRRQRREDAVGAGGPVEAAARQQQPAAMPRRRAAASPSYQFKDLPSRGEARRFARSTRAAGAGSLPSTAAVGSLSPEEAAARAAAVAAERARYERLKVEFQGWTLGLGLLGTLTCYFVYDNDVAISYVLGASSGLTYLRLLSRSVDAVGDEATGGVNTAIGQPRLLVPVVMALTYNRWNTLYASDYGVTLSLYGMLTGFFTYKLAVLGRQGLELLLGDADDASAAGGESTASGGSSDGVSDGTDSAMTLDRIFVQRALRE